MPNPKPSFGRNPSSKLRVKHEVSQFVGTVFKEGTATASFILKSGSSLGELLYLELNDLVEESRMEKLREKLDREVENLTALKEAPFNQPIKTIDAKIKVLIEAFVAKVEGA